MQLIQRVAIALAALTVTVPVFAEYENCDVASNYSLDLKGEGIAFSSKLTAPNHVRLSRGHLYIDGHEVVLNARDRRAISDIESEIRGITAEAIVIASDGIDILFDVLSELSRALIDDSSRHAEMVRSMEKTRAIVQTRIRDAVLNRPFDDKAFEALVESQFETMASELVKVLVGEFLPRAIAAALSGDEVSVKAIEAGAERLEAEIENRIEGRAKEIEKRIEGKAKEIERRAKLLCPRVQSLIELASSLAVRLPDGSPLNLIEQ